MPNDQVRLLVDDIDDDVTQPRACLPTRLITLDAVHATRPLDLNEEYYRHLSDALDAALKL
jgi:hypothetical protein